MVGSQVRIMNRTDIVLEDVSITTGQVSSKYGSLPPSRTLHQTVSSQDSTQLLVRYSAGGMRWLIRCGNISRRGELRDVVVLEKGTKAIVRFGANTESVQLAEVDQ